MSRSEPNDTKKTRPSIDGLTIGLMAAFLVVGVIAAILSYTVVRNLAATWTMTGDIPGAPEISSAAQQATALSSDGTPIVQALQAPAGPTPQPWDGASRVTLLLMGLDFRDWEAGEVPRTDTMMLLTLDPLSNTAGMLSVPRDMWVSIPGFDYAKINTAYYLGEIYKLPGGGPALAMKTVEELLGVPIDYYAQIDFYAFARFIDDMGGLTVHVRDEITVDPLGPGNTVKLYPGVQDLDGATTLAYARARYTEGGDFDRAQRQQDVIMAMRHQILAVDMLPSLIAKAPVMYQNISDGIHTNLTLQQVIELALLAVKVPEKSIKQGVIGPPNQVYLATSPDGLSIDIPIPDNIRLLRDEIFTTGGPIGPAAVAQDPLELMKAEQARVIVQNGTQTAGLATRTSDYLRSQGLNVLGETNADQVYQASTLYIVNGKPYTAKYIANLMGIDTSNIMNRYDPTYQADIVIIVGDDWANKNVIP